MSPKLQQLKDSGAYRVNETEIHGFFEEYRWLSNFHLCPLTYEGVVFPSSENAYQAAKFGKDEMIGVDKTFINARAYFASLTPSESKKMGRLAELDPEWWDERKKGVMRDVLVAKFENAELAQMLRDTAPRHLEETNWWKDTTWGVCNGVGKNWMGELLMEIRDEKAKT